MTVLPIDLNEGLDDFTWSQDSILYHVDASIPSKDIYQAICDEIGRFYKAKGFKYAGSSKKLEYAYQDFKFKLHFSSSHYNTAGEWVWVEISAGMYPVRLEKQYKADKETLVPIILFNLGLLDEVIPDRPPGTIITVTPLGEEMESIKADYPYALRKYARGFNAYNISLDSFKNIIRYINKLIEYMFSLVLNESEMMKHIERAIARNARIHKEKRFIDYVHLYYAPNSRLFQFIAAANEHTG